MNRRNRDQPGRAARPAVEAARAGAFGRKATLLFASMLTIMSGATISPSLPAIEAHFAGVENVELLTRFVLTVPALLIALCAPLAGGLADRYGRRRLLIGAIVLYGGAGMSGLVLDTLPGLLVGRAFLGTAVAVIMTVATALAGDYFSGRERDRFMGLQASFIGFGGLVFLTSGGLLAELHWRAPFAVYASAFVLLPAVLLFLVEPARAHLSPAATGRVAPGGGGVGTAIAALFATAVLNSVVFYLVPTQLPFYLHALGTPAPSQAGLAIGLFTLSSAVVALAYGRVRARLGIPGTFALGFGLMAAGYGIVAAAATFAAIGLGLVITGIGMGLVMPNLGAAAMTLAPPAIHGRVAGGLTASIFLGQFLSPLASQPLVAAYGFAGAYRVAAVTVAAAAVLAVGLATWQRLRGPAVSRTRPAPAGLAGEGEAGGG